MIEDDVPATDVVAVRLRQEGLMTERVQNGYEAIDRLSARRYDAIVLDLIIHSGLNGFGVLSFIESEKPELMSRVFLSTAMPEETVVRTAPRLASRHYRKPMHNARLAEDLITFLQRRAIPLSGAPADVAVLPRVLIVDDDRSTADLMASLTQTAGWLGETVTDGREAIAKLDKSDYAAVLLDLVMPEVDGFSVLDYLQQRKPKALGCTIVLTGLPERYRGQLSKYAVLTVLEKPVDVNRFSEALRRCDPGTR